MLTYFRLFLLLCWVSSSAGLFAQKSIGTTALNAPQKSRVALLIGNKNYTNIDPLTNTERDIDALEKTLKSLGFKVLSHKNLTLLETQRAFQAFLSLIDKEQPEAVWLYFSGHGLGVNGVNYLLPTNTQISCVEQVQSQATSLNSWIEELSRRQIKHNFIVLDACRNLPLKHCNGAAITGEVRGLAKPTEKYRGFLIAFATTEGVTADDNTFDPTNSLFTSELLKYLSLPNIGIRQILDMTKQGVYLRSGQTQDPKRWDDLVEDYVFLRTQAPALTPVVDAKVISVVAYKPNSTDLDMGLAKLAQQQLKTQLPDYDIQLQTGSKSLLDAGVTCIVTRQTSLGTQEVLGYQLVKAETQLTLQFRQGKTLLDEVELSEGGTDHQKNIAIQNSIERAFEHLKNQTINLKR